MEIITSTGRNSRPERELDGVPSARGERMLSLSWYAALIGNLCRNKRKRPMSDSSSDVQGDKRRFQSQDSQGSKSKRMHFPVIVPILPKSQIGERESRSGSVMDQQRHDLGISHLRWLQSRFQEHYHSKESHPVPH